MIKRTILAILLLVLLAVYLLNMTAGYTRLFHILLSTLTLCILSIAALQALLLGLQEWLLRHQPTNQLIQRLPSLEIMEFWLFRLLAIGFALLTCVLISSIIIFHTATITFFWQKLLLSLFAWIIFAILLLGRWYFGWRGQLAIRSTIAGVTLITLVYFGSVLL